MNIIKNDLSHYRQFDELDVGDVFIEYMGENEYIQMKTESFRSRGGSVNAVSLVSGELYHIKPSTLVRVVDADLVIK